MLNLHFASSLDRLLPVILDQVHGAWVDPFDPPSVIVPSPAIGKWLHMRLADGAAPADGASSRPLQCVANLKPLMLENFIWESLRPEEDMALLDAASIRQVVCALIDEHILGEAIYAPLRDYLAMGECGGIDPLKRVQVSARIAHQFLEYEYNRPSVWDPGRGTWRTRGVDHAWLAGGDYFAAGSLHEAWQRDLYCRVVDCLDSPKRPRLITLPRLYRLRREDADVSWAVPSGEILIFGVTKISHFHRNTLVEISQMPGIAMSVLLTNPCAEFWEDVDTSRGRLPRRRWHSASGLGEAGIAPRLPEEYNKPELSDFVTLPPDHRLLKLWGGAGKENVFLWCPPADWNFEYHGPTPGEGDAPDSLLGALQSALLSRQEDLPAREGGWCDDGSLVILACPDRGREVEELRERVMDLIHERTIDALTDIAVYLPDPAAYTPYLRRVFGAYAPGDPRHIPFTILGAPGGESLFARGMGLFLDLFEGRFDRAHVFALLRNPIVQSSRTVSPRQVALWERWAEALGIYRGYDRRHREAMGDRGLAITDAHTFAHGMTRMLIGNLAAGPVALDLILPEAPGGDGSRSLPPYRDFDSADADLLESFCVVIDGLYRDLTDLQESLNRGICEGVMRLRELVAKWFSEIDEDSVADAAGEGRARREFNEALETLCLQSSRVKRDRVPLPEFVPLVRECLPAELSAFSAAWVGGITIAPLRPSMIVPHRVIFILGLDAAAFPGTGEKSAWDLLSLRRIIGDSDPVRDNRFAFLEALHAARERLILSYRGRNMQKEEELQPSSVVLELEAYLLGQGLRKTGDAGARCAVHRVVPWVVHESLDFFISQGRRHGSWQPEEIVLYRESLKTRVRHRYEIDTRGRGVAVPAPTEGLLRTNLYHIRTFFANPLEYHLSKTLGIQLDEEPATMGAADEPLDSGNLARSSLQRGIWAAVLALLFPMDPADAITDSAALIEAAEAIAGRHYDEHAAAGRSPEAQFCRMERQVMVRWASSCAEASLALLASFLNHRLLENGDLSLGREGFAGELALALDGDRTAVIECRHGMALVPRRWEAAGSAVGIIDIQREGAASDNPRLWFAGVLQWLTERTSTGAHDTAIMLVQLNRDDKKGPCSSLSRMKHESDSGRRIDRWFTDLLAEMMITRCSDHLPFASVNAVYRDDWANITREALNDELEGEYSSYRCYLEAFALADARIPRVENEEQLQAIVKRRFAPMLERWLHE